MQHIQEDRFEKMEVIWWAHFQLAYHNEQLLLEELKQEIIHEHELGYKELTSAVWKPK